MTIVMSAILNDHSRQDSSIREGFLCPICLQDLNSVYQLQIHFEESHSSEDKAVVQHLKGFFGKAKKLLSKNDEQVASVGFTDDTTEDGDTTARFTTTCVGGFDVRFGDPQEIGACRGHFAYFTSQRGSSIDRSTVETNKILIRLEKLARYYKECSDLSRRKGKRGRRDFEKTVAPWKEDSTMKYCAFCMERFGLSLRRHHCRLCGNIACAKCSDFLPNIVCENLQKSEEELLRYYEQKEKRGAEGEQTDCDVNGTLRVCKHCDELLVKRLQQIKFKLVKPAFVLLYERLTEVKNHILDQLTVFNPKVESLLSGSSSQSRDSLERERMKILKSFDLIDTISKKILALCSSTSSPAQQRLYQKIRSHCTLFLQANMHSMVALPTQEELDRLLAERRAAISRRIQEEKEAELEAQRQERLLQEKRELKTVESTVKKGHNRMPSWPLTLTRRESGSNRVAAGGGANPSIAGGWKPSVMSEAELAASSDNPMVQQMVIIRNYIRQARAGQRLDEVKMLEENLGELETEYRKQSRY